MKKRIIAITILLTILIVFSAVYVNAQEVLTFKDFLNSIKEIFSGKPIGATKTSSSLLSVKITYPTTGLNFDGISITAMGSSSNADYVRVRLNNGAWQKANGLRPWSIKLDLFNAGSNTIKASACNKEICSQEKSVTFNYIPIGPIARIVRDLFGGVVSYTPVTIPGVFFNSHYVQIRVNNGQWQEATITDADSWRADVNLDVGNNILEARGCNTDPCS